MAKNYTPFKPDFEAVKRTDRNFMSLYYAASSYLRTEIDSKVLKSNAIKWLKKNKKLTTDQFKELESLSDYRYEVMGRLCYIMNNGGEVPETGLPFIDKQVDEFLVVAKQKKEEKLLELAEDPAQPIAEKKGVQEHLRDQASVVGADFDAFIDGFVRDHEGFELSKFNPLSAMRNAQFKAAQARHIKKFYQNDYDELIQVRDKTDTDLVEAYSNLSKKKLKDLIALYDKIFDAVNVLATATKAAKKPRKKKAIDLNKLVSKLKYKKEDVALGIASIKPIDILGAREIWVYNTKTRKIARIVSEHPAGLSVKSTTLLNYSEAKSVQKTLRKPKEQLKEFKKNTSNGMNKVFDAVKGVDTKIRSRLSEDTVILKAFNDK